MNKSYDHNGATQHIIPFDSLQKPCKTACVKSTGGLEMALSSHLAELVRRHTALENEIRSAKTHPSTDALSLAELKRKKLLLKDEIERLKESPSLH